MHVYREKHSTCTALLQLSDDVFQVGDSREIAAAMLIDKSSAFECINFKILNDKLELYGIGWKMRKWLMSYLNN